MQDDYFVGALQLDQFVDIMNDVLFRFICVEQKLAWFVQECASWDFDIKLKLWMILEAHIANSPLLDGKMNLFVPFVFLIRKLANNSRIKNAVDIRTFNACFSNLFIL